MCRDSVGSVGTSLLSARPPNLADPVPSRKLSCASMSDEGTPNESVSPYAQEWLDQASVGPAVTELRPDYTAVIVVAEGLRPGPSDDASDALLAAAEAQALKALAAGAPADLAPVA